MALIHLVRQVTPSSVLERFLSSYRANSAGLPHDLLLICKGFDGKLSYQHQQLLASYQYRPIFVSDEGFDIGPYFSVVASENYENFVFLNSFARLLAQNWMLKMFNSLSTGNVGAVSATGSWQSQYGVASGPPPGSVLERRLKIIRKYMLGRRIPAFPNYHLRTNAFMASRKTLLSIQLKPPRTKKDAHQFESGCKSFTRQVIGMNKRVLVVGSNGQSYEKEQWWQSETFRQGSQGNLLVADNQTDYFNAAAIDLKRRLSLEAWGDKSEFA